MKKILPLLLLLNTAFAQKHIYMQASPVRINPNTPNVVCNEATPVTYTILQTGAPGEIFRPNGTAWKGGDTLKITGLNYTGGIEFYGVGGDACRDLIIVANDTFRTAFFRFKGNCHNITLLGRGTRPNQSIKVIGSSVAIAMSNHITVDNVEIGGGSIGIYCKQDPLYDDTLTWYPNYRMTKFKFIRLWVHDINGEGMYIGHTQPSGVPTHHDGHPDTTIIPIRLDSVEVSNCLVERTQWDGIQLSSCRNGNKIFNDTVLNYGLLNKSSQQAGIISGGNMNSEIFNNTVKHGTGNGLEVFGYGVFNIYNNLFDYCGYDDSTYELGHQGQHSIYTSDYLTGPESNPKQTINLYNTAVDHPPTRGAIKIAYEFSNANPSTVTNNTFCIPGAAPSWQSQYILIYTPGSTNTANVLYCGTVLSLPPVQPQNHPIRYPDVWQDQYNIYVKAKTRTAYSLTDIAGRCMETGMLARGLHSLPLKYASGFYLFKYGDLYYEKKKFISIIR